MYIDKLSYQALNLKEIDELIQPISALGRSYRQEAKLFTVGMEKNANLQYQIVEKLMNCLQDKYDFWETAKNALLHLEPVHNIVQRAAELKTLEIFEIYEVKNFLYFSGLIKNLLEKYQLESIHRIPNFQELFSFLDKDGQRSPSFHLSTLYSAKYGEVTSKISTCNNRLNHEMTQLLEKAKIELEVNEIEDRIVVSRYNQELNIKLQASDCFSLESENFANNTYRLRKNDSILRIEQELDMLRYEQTLEEKAIRVEITKVISVYRTDLELALQEVAAFDLALVKAYFGNKYNCTIPDISSEDKISIRSAVNLPIAVELKKNGLIFQPLDLDFEKNINVLTGANMGGKTTILKLLGQCAYMVAHSIPLPCNSAKVPLVDFIYFSGLQSNRMDLSSFGSEVVAVDEALKRDGMGLFLLDEFARGTNPQEGEAFSSAILMAFENKEAICFAATHFSLPATLKQAAHYRIRGIRAIQVENLQSNSSLETRLQELHRYMDYSLERVEAGAEPPRSALMIASLLGVGDKIIDCAKQFLEDSNKE